jgi:hypothetical protein
MECAGDELPEVLYFPGSVEVYAVGVWQNRVVRMILKIGLCNLVLL